MSTVSSPATPAPPSAPVGLALLWTRLALFVSVAGVVGSIYLSAEMNLKACPLCFYQRAFVMSVAAILGMGLLLRGVTPAALTPLALACTVAGAGIAGFHTYLDATGFLECPLGISGKLTAPQESALIYALLLALLLLDLFHEQQYVVLGLGAMGLGAVLAVLCLLPRVTPPPPEPKSPYTAPLDGCRRVYAAALTP